MNEHSLNYMTKTVSVLKDICLQNKEINFSLPCIPFNSIKQVDLLLILWHTGFMLLFAQNL